MSNSTPSSVNRNDKRAQELREKARRFRILIIGRANSGKTTILQKICKTDENPEIFNNKGEKVCCICLYYVVYLDVVISDQPGCY
jgi:septin family protein